VYVAEIDRDFPGACVVGPVALVALVGFVGLVVVQPEGHLSMPLLSD
jgi:hypothetical protein